MLPVIAQVYCYCIYSVQWACSVDHSKRSQRKATLRNLVKHVYYCREGPSCDTTPSIYYTVHISPSNTTQKKPLNKITKVLLFKHLGQNSSLSILMQELYTHWTELYLVIRTFMFTCFVLFFFTSLSSPPNIYIDLLLIITNCININNLRV